MSIGVQWLRAATFVVVVLWALPARAELVIGAGSSVDFADAAADLGCADLTVSGQLIGAAADLHGIGDFLLTASGNATGVARLALGGDFNNQGSFTAGSGRVEVVDACGDGLSRFFGATAFHALSVVTGNGKQLVLPSLVAQAIAQELTLQGIAGGLLRVRSSAAGQQAVLAVAGTASQSIAYVDAADNNASLATIAPGAAAGYHSLDGGNLNNWFENSIGGEPGGGAAPIPSLDAIGRGLLIALLAFVLYRRLAARRA